MIQTRFGSEIDQLEWDGPLGEVEGKVNFRRVSDGKHFQGISINEIRATNGFQEIVDALGKR